MWLSAIKLAMSTGSKIYANRQRTKQAMSDAQLMHAEKMARGEEAYQGKLLEARQSDWKDEAVLIILSLPVVILVILYCLQELVLIFYPLFFTSVFKYLCSLYTIDARHDKDP